ncbi:hypothetical protein RZR97_08060 [Hydrogenimonas thermophila]|nr:hypothetical protein [Hydrogenimonas thermophila]WOE69063.1 hypothetical protein RZR91_08085 [Hydrogenimonas thermophila]WOE71573.1 hypothetical protein RZR97_08060 [Hydrogenimonas thermophila]
MSIINDMSKYGKEIEVIDDISYEKESRMINVKCNPNMYQYA